MATGLARCIDILVKTHVNGGRIGTVTAVHPTSKYGEVQFEGDQVVEFNEKPTQVTGWVSGGCFIFESRSLMTISMMTLSCGWNMLHCRDSPGTGNSRLIATTVFGVEWTLFRTTPTLINSGRTGPPPWRTWEGEPGMGQSPTRQDKPCRPSQSPARLSPPERSHMSQRRLRMVGTKMRGRTPALREGIRTLRRPQRCSCVAELYVWLHLSVLAANIGPGDEVRVPETTWIGRGGPRQLCRRHSGLRRH